MFPRHFSLTAAITLALLILFAPAKAEAGPAGQPPSTTRLKRLMILPAPPGRGIQASWADGVVPDRLHVFFNQVYGFLPVTPPPGFRFALREDPRDLAREFSGSRADYVMICGAGKDGAFLKVLDTAKGRVVSISCPGGDPRRFAASEYFVRSLGRAGITLPAGTSLEEELDRIRFESEEGMKHYLLAQAALAGGDPAAAEPLTAKALEEEPANISYLCLQARVWAGMGQWEKARLACKEILMIDPRRQDAINCLGLSYAALGKTGRAVAVFREGLEKLPGNGMLMFNLAQMLEKTGDPGGAEKAYYRLLWMDPRNDVARYNLALLYVSGGYYSHALPHFEKLEAENPGQPYYSYQAAWALLGMGQLNEAERKLLKISRQGRFKEVYNDLGLLSRVKGQAGEAEGWFLEAIRVDPRYLPAYNNLGILEMSRGNPKRTRQWLEKALKINPRYAEATYNMGLLQMEQGQYRAAAQYFRRAGEQNPGFYQAGVNEAICLSYTGRAEEGTEILMNLLKARPTEALILYNAGVLYQMTGEPGLALECFGRLLHHHPHDVDGIINASALLLMQKEPDRAGELAEQGLKLQPGNGDLLYLSGLALYQKGRHAQAAEFFEKAAIKSPSLRQARLYLARSLLASGQFQKARARIDQLIKEDPGDQKALYLKAVHLQRTGNPGEAARILESIAGSLGRDQEAYLALARLYLSMDRLDKAAEVFARLTEADPGNPEHYIDLGVIMMVTGQWPRAEEAMKKAVELRPGDALAYFHLGTIYVEQKDYRKAARAYGQALTFEPSDVRLLANLALCHAFLGEPGEASRAIGRAMEIEPQNPLLRYIAAVTYAISGDRENMLSLLKESVRMDPSLKERAKKDEDLKNYFNDPGFLKIVQ
jgi:tetratricopeptide (TPR) repeat protein